MSNPNVKVIKGKRPITLLVVSCLVLLAACEGLGQGAKSDKLSRATALAIINKNLQKRIHVIDMQIPLWAQIYDGEYEQSRAERGKYPTEDINIDNWMFLNFLVKEGFLKLDSTEKNQLASFGRESTWYRYSLVPQAGYEQAQYDANVNFNTLKFTMCVPKALNITGITQRGDDFAVADVVVSQLPTPSFISFLKMEERARPQIGNPGFQAKIVSGMGYCPAESQKSVQFRKYDDGWRMM